MKRKNSISVFLFVLAALGLAQESAFARLGEHESSISAEVRALRTARRVRRAVSAQDRYKVHELEMDGDMVREYVNDDGLVFAVSWRGTAHPNLQEIFGDYYQEYQDAESAMPTPRGRAPKQMKTLNLQIHRFGHMRDVHGKACIPSLMPEGVSLRDLE